MSGGHFDYAGGKILVALESISHDDDVRDGWPRLAKVLCDLAYVLAKIERDIDYDLSGDSQIEDRAAFEIMVMGKILDVVLKSLPDEVFTRGKWATIQAWQMQTGSEEFVA